MLDFAYGRHRGLGANPGDSACVVVTYIFVYPANMLKTRDFEYEIDSSGKYKLKKSFEKLVNAFDVDLVELFNSLRPLPLEYFNDPANVEKFVMNNAAYLKNLLKEPLEGISRYEAMLGLDDPENQELEPEFITAPYFYFRNTADPWYNINVRMSQLTKELNPDDKVFSVVCTEKQNLNDVLADKVATDFDRIDGFLMFISNFSESAETVPLLRQLMRFVNRLNTISPKPILNLYG